MLYDFFSACKPVLGEEAMDYSHALRRFANLSTSVGFMPVVTDDLYPIAALSAPGARKILPPNVYILPCGGHNYWANPYFENMIRKFYEADELPESGYDIELEETLLLHNPNFNRSFSLGDGTECNVVYCHIALADGSEKYLFLVPENPWDCWERIIEPYGIKCDIVIDSHKGMGNWFEWIPLYDLMRETKATELLPRYYFKGLYISHPAPPGFTLLCPIPDRVTDQEGRIVEDWAKEIYEIDWEENRKHPSGASDTEQGSATRTNSADDSGKCRCG